MLDKILIAGLLALLPIDLSKVVAPFVVAVVLFRDEINKILEIVWQFLNMKIKTLIENLKQRV